MSTATETAANPFEQTLEHFRKSAQSALTIQQELLGQWAKMWSATGNLPTNGANGCKNSKAATPEPSIDLLRKHREILDRQHRAAIESLEETFHLVSSKDPEELCERCGALCRKMLDVMKETTESQMQELPRRNE